MIIKPGILIRYSMNRPAIAESVGQSNETITLHQVADSERRLMDSIKAPQMAPRLSVSLSSH